MLAGEQSKIMSLLCDRQLCDTQECTPLIHSSRSGLSEGTVNVFKLKKKLHLDCINEKLAPQRVHADLEVRPETPERNSDINVVYLKEMKSKGICQIQEELLCVLSKLNIPFLQGLLCCHVYTQTNKCLTFFSDEGTVCASGAYYFKKHK